MPMVSKSASFYAGGSFMKERSSFTGGIGFVLISPDGFSRPAVTVEFLFCRFNAFPFPMLFRPELISPRLFACVCRPYVCRYIVFLHKHLPFCLNIFFLFYNFYKNSVSVFKSEREFSVRHFFRYFTVFMYFKFYGRAEI